MTEVNIFIAFIFGALSFVSPCVLPLLPGYLGLMSGYSAAELTTGEASVRRVAIATVLFISGFTAVFVALGAGAFALSGFLLRNQIVTNRIAGAVIIGFGAFIAIAALWNPRFLAGMMRERRVEVRPSRLGAWAPPVMGVAFGFGWTPCIGPVLASILTLAASSSTAAEGMLLLFAYSMGLGIPFLLAAIGLSKAMSAFTWLRSHLRQINVASGALLALFGVLMITGRLNEISSWFQELLTNVGLERLANI
jgi:cytochrome c-type biogenesis protein